MLQYPAIMGLLAGLVTWGFTSLGAAAVFSPREFSRRTLDIMLGVAAGVMLAASFWSLLDPALEMARPGWGVWCFVPVALGFLGGAVVLRLLDILLPHLHPLEGFEEGTPTHLSRSVLLVLAITLHNIPEGLAVGVAFGAATAAPEMGFAGAVTLMLGIGLQNLPEGMAVSVPLISGGMGKTKAVLLTALSGLPTVLGAVLGYALGGINEIMLMLSLGFASGAMLYVVFGELLPESILMWKSKMPALSLFVGVLAGFLLVMF